LRRFVDEGRLVLGICNGFQVLVRAGLLPGETGNSQEIGNVSRETLLLDNKAMASLVDNESAQFECRWVTLNVEISTCLFTQWIKQPIELPVAHGEGQFVLADETILVRLRKNGQVPLVYAAPTGNDVAYPYNPNGSVGNIAGVCNKQGNVFGLMPHPERYVSALQHPQRRGRNGGNEGDGLLIFRNAYEYARTLDVGAARSAHQFSAPTPTIKGANVGAQFVASEPAAPSSSRSVINRVPTEISSDARVGTAYATSGVDIAAAERAKDLMKEAVRATQGPEVVAGMGAFAGVFALDGIQRMSRPALVASTDGVGTKTLIAAQMQRFDTIGYDLVNHSVNDLLTQGAKPLFFMDYLAMGKLEAVQAAAIVQSVAEACREVGCTLLGGETAEMPDVYVPGAFDLAGTIVGVVEQDEVINGDIIEVGDVLLGFPSSGLHTNGYSLARRVFAPYALEKVFPELGEPLGEALLRPHKCYLREIERIREYLGDRGQAIKGMAHITGGGFEGNISRILPAGKQAVIETSSWKVPPLFTLIEHLGQVERAEMYRAFNMGVGMVLVLSRKGALEARCVFPELIAVGYIRQGNGVVLDI
jgi:phosphoribosylformylglycinamidine synthase I